MQAVRTYTSGILEKNTRVNRIFFLLRQYIRSALAHSFINGIKSLAYKSNRYFEKKFLDVFRQTCFVNLWSLTLNLWYASYCSSN